MHSNVTFNEFSQTNLVQLPSLPTKVPLLAEASDESGSCHEALCMLFVELGREMGSDSMMVALHRDAFPPEMLLEIGTCPNLSDFKARMFETAASAVLKSRTPHSPNWFFLDSCEIAHILTVPVVLSGSVFSVTALFRDQSAAMRKQTLEVFTYFLPFVCAFLRIWLLYRDNYARILGLTAAINHSDIGTVLINKCGKTIFISDFAQKMILVGDGVRHNGGHLTCKSLTETLRLQAAIEHVTNNSDLADSDDFGFSPVVAISRESKRPVMAAIVSHRCQDSSNEDTAAIVYLFDPESSLDTRILPVCELYHLSHVETRLACSLANGSTLADAAKVMHVKQQTARSYLKQIFVKTDTNRQAELVWLLLKSSVRTGQHCQTGLV